LSEEEMTQLVGTPIGDIPPSDRIFHTLLAFILGFKNVNQNYIASWVNKRISAMFQSLIGSTYAMRQITVFPGATFLGAYLSEQIPLLEVLVKFV
jgi:hypothetical protein